MLRNSSISEANKINKESSDVLMQKSNTIEKRKVKITSYRKLTSFGYNIKTPAIVELYSNQIAILKAGGVVIEEISEK